MQQFNIYLYHCFRGLIEGGRVIGECGLIHAWRQSNWVIGECICFHLRYDSMKVQLIQLHKSLLGQEYDCQAPKGTPRNVWSIYEECPSDDLDLPTLVLMDGRIPRLDTRHQTTAILHE